MKALFVNNLYPPIIFGGYEVLCHRMAGAFRYRGWEIKTITSSFRADERPDDPDVLPVLKLSSSFPKPGAAAVQTDFSPDNINRVAEINSELVGRVIADWRPDVVFCWCLNRLSLGPVIAAQRAGVPVIYTINDKHPVQYVPLKNKPGALAGVKGLVERRKWPLFSFQAVKPFPVTIISQALKDQLLGLGVPISHSEVIHQGISIHYFPCEPLDRQPNEDLLVVYAGQLSRDKGVHTLVEAMGRLKDRGRGEFVLELVGDGVPEYTAELEAIVERHSLGGRIRFLGRLDADDMAAVYRRHHLLVFPSEWPEPFGLTHIEAMASGTAVISTTTGGSAELIKHEENALAYAAGDADHLADSIERLMDDEELRRKLARAGRAYVEEHHSFTDYADRLHGFVLRAMGRGKD